MYGLYSDPSVDGYLIVLMVRPLCSEDGHCFYFVA